MYSNGGTHTKKTNNDNSAINKQLRKELVIRRIGRGSKHQAEELTLEFVNPDVAIIFHLRRELFGNLTFWG